jgi:hypothetical protein
MALEYEGDGDLEARHRKLVGERLCQEGGVETGVAVFG